MKKTKISMESFIELCKKDINEFISQFGKDKFMEVAQSGNLPLRRETVEILKKDKRFGKIDYTKFL